MIVVGRKNWMFYGIDTGGRTGAVLTSLIASCKRLRIDRFVYLRDAFARISTHPQNQLEELLPDRWLTAQQAVLTFAPYSALLTRAPHPGCKLTERDAQKPI